MKPDIALQLIRKSKAARKKKNPVQMELDRAAVRHEREIMYANCREYGLPEPVPEFLFHPLRKWRVDWFFEANGRRVALEIEGGIFTNPKTGRKGAHGSTEGILRDIEKYNALALEGIFVYRVLSKNRRTPKVFNDLKRLIYG